MCSLSHGECVVSPMRARRVKLPYKGTLPIWIWDVDVDVNEHIKINPKWILYKNINFCAIIEFGNGFTFAISIFRSKITWSRISPRGHADWTGCQKESSESKFKVNRFLYKFECRRVGDERKNSSQIRWTFLSSLFLRNYYKFFESIHPLNGSACQVHTHWTKWNQENTIRNGYLLRTLVNNSHARHQQCVFNGLFHSMFGNNVSSGEGWRSTIAAIRMKFCVNSHCIEIDGTCVAVVGMWTWTRTPWNDDGRVHVMQFSKSIT